jgi:arylmalonate decarboxylase
MSRRPKIGLIIPAAGNKVPDEAAQMYPGIDFVAEGLGLRTMNQQGYDSVVDRIAEAAETLAAREIDAITLIGTSLSFYKGAAFNEALVDSIRRTAGLPCTSMSTAILEGLRAVGARRLAVATAYIDDVNERLRRFLTESGFRVQSIVGLSIETSGIAGSVPDDELVALGKRASGQAPQADALLISCGGLRTLGVTVPLERATGLPVVSSMPAALWAAARLVGHDGRSAGFGRLLDNGYASPDRAAISA